MGPEKPWKQKVSEDETKQTNVSYVVSANRINDWKIVKDRHIEAGG